jgi:hypothetical protein
MLKTALDPDGPCWQFDGVFFWPLVVVLDFFVGHTVDGGNPAPVSRWFVPL